MSTSDIADAAVNDLRCWQCHIEPTDMHEVRTLAGVVSVVPVWPSGDHDHASTPPTPGELLAVGARAADRVMETWTDEQ